MDLEKRVIRLEEELAFQERLAEGLHTALLEQQKQIDQLELILQKQSQRLEEMADALSESGSGAVLEKPPHYL